MTSVNDPRPAPVNTGSPAVWPMVIADVEDGLGDCSADVLPLVLADMRERDAFGRARYGVPLRADDGRDHLIDALQETYDCAVYMRAALQRAITEGRHPGVIVRIYRSVLQNAFSIRSAIAARDGHANQSLDPSGETARAAIGLGPDDEGVDTLAHIAELKQKAKAFDARPVLTAEKALTLSLLQNDVKRADIYGHHYTTAKVENLRTVLALLRGDVSETAERAPHMIKDGKADRPGSGLFGRLTGEELQAAHAAHFTKSPATAPTPEMTTMAVGLDREALGRLVREAWIEWASEQPSPKASWLAPWWAMSEPDREVDRRIGERLAVTGGHMTGAAWVKLVSGVVNGLPDAARDVVWPRMKAAIDAAYLRVAGPETAEQASVALTFAVAEQSADSLCLECLSHDHPRKLEPVSRRNERGQPVCDWHSSGYAARREQGETGHGMLVAHPAMAMAAEAIRSSEGAAFEAAAERGGK